MYVSTTQQFLILTSDQYIEKEEEKESTSNYKVKKKKLKENKRNTKKTIVAIDDGVG